MSDDLPLNRLSVEFQFPNCKHCGASGDFHVTRSSSNGDPWRCLDCGELFEAHHASKWHGIDQLTDAQRRDYVACEIREIGLHEWASTVGVDRDTVATNLKRARNALGKTRTEPREAVS